MRNPKQLKNESSRARKHADTSVNQKEVKPTMRFFKSSDEICTLKENTIKNLCKELAQAKQYQFGNKFFAKICCQKISEVYQIIYLLAGTYKIEPSTFCLFDKVFRNFVTRNLKDFLSISTRIPEKSVENLNSQNVGTNYDNSTDSQNPDFLAHLKF